MAALCVGGGALAATWGAGDKHYALDPTRDCVALRGGLVTFVSGGASEGSLTVDVKGDQVVLDFARTSAEARLLARGAGGASRHGNLVIRPRSSGIPAAQAASTVERCLSDGLGRPKAPPTGYRYPDDAIAAFEAACANVHASQAQCRCVLTGAQARMPLGDFERIAATTVPAEEAQMTLLLDGCRLVG